MTDGTLRLACLQLNSRDNYQQNLEALLRDLKVAADGGAQLVLTPEYSLLMDGSGRVMRNGAMDAEGNPALSELCESARTHHLWLLVGSLTLKVSGEQMVNRSVLIDPSGAVVARYDKIHMFDVTLPDGRSIRESSAYRPGERAVIAETPWGGIGMTVCYDLRFPHLYRRLAQQGAVMLSIPASFQRQTGTAHWHTLLKARAIENAAFVIAPAMCGDHGGNRQSYGHSLVVDPWGEVLVDGGETPGVVFADINLGKVAKIRSMMPSLQHDRQFSF
jgi:predicted amidohydrolase